MTIIYLLITLCQFSPSNFGFLAVAGPQEVIVRFDKLNGIKPGAPVLAEGQLIGTVDRIRAESEEKEQVEAKTQADRLSQPFEVVVKIAPRHRGLLRHGTVALISSPMTASRVKPETVIELLIPQDKSQPVLENEAGITGYSSYDSFWSADVTKLVPKSFSFCAS